MECGKGNGTIIIRIAAIYAMRRAGNRGAETSDTIMAAALYLMMCLFTSYFVWLLLTVLAKPRSLYSVE